MRKNFPGKKCTAAFCALLLFLQQPFEAGGAPALSPPSAFLPEIPGHLGVISEIYSPETESGRQPVVLLQDAHAAYPVQRKIADLLEFLDQRSGKKIVLLAEAAPERLYPENLKVTEDPDLNLRAFDRLMQWGELAGWENFILAAYQRNETVTAYGIENTELYHENWTAFRDVYAAKAACAAGLEKLENRLEDVSRRFFDKPQAVFLEAWKDRQTGRRDMLAYAKELNERFEGLPGRESQLEYPVLSRLSAVLAMQRDNRHSEALETEMKRLRHFMREKDLSPVHTRALTSEAREDDAELRLELERFYDAAGPAGFRFADYPAMSRQWGIRLLTAEIRPESLEAELNRFEEKILTRWAQTTEQKKIMALYRGLVMLIKTLELSLSREDYEVFLKKKEHFSPSVWIRYLSELDEKVEKKDAGLLEEGFAAALRFYDAAVRREDAFARNIQKVLKKHPDALPVIITGGFHTPALAGVFRGLRQPFISLMPAVGFESYETGLDEAHRAYVNALLEGKKATMGLYSYLASPGDARAAGVNLPHRQNRIKNAVRSVRLGAKSEVRTDANRRHRLITRMMQAQEQPGVTPAPKTPALERYPELKPRKAGWGSFLFFLSVTAAGFFAAALVFLPGFRQETARVFRDLQNRIVREQDQEEVLPEWPAAQPLGDEAIEKMFSRPAFKIERTRMKRTFIPEPLPVPERIRPEVPETVFPFSVDLPPLALHEETLIPQIILEELQKNDFDSPQRETQNEALTAPRGAFSVVRGDDYLLYDIVSNIHRGETQRDDASYGKTSINNLRYRESGTGREFSLREAAQKPVVLILTPALPGPISRQLNDMAAQMEHLQFMYVFPANAELDGSWKPDAALEQLQSSVTARIAEKNPFHLPAAVWTSEIMKELGWVGGHTGFQDGKRVDILILIPGRGETRGKIFARTAIPEKDLSRWLDEIEAYGKRGETPAVLRSEIRAIEVQAKVMQAFLKKLARKTEIPLKVRKRIRELLIEALNFNGSAYAKSVRLEHAAIRLNEELMKQGYHLRLDLLKEKREPFRPGNDEVQRMKERHDKKNQNRPEKPEFEVPKSRVIDFVVEPALFKLSEDGPVVKDGVTIFSIASQLVPAADENALAVHLGWVPLLPEKSYVILHEPLIFNAAVQADQIKTLFDSDEIRSAGDLLGHYSFLKENDPFRALLSGPLGESLFVILKSLWKKSFYNAGANEFLFKYHQMIRAHEETHMKNLLQFYQRELPFFAMSRFYGDSSEETLTELGTIASGDQPEAVLLMNLNGAFLSTGRTRLSHRRVLTELAGLPDGDFSSESFQRELLQALRSLSESRDRLKEAAQRAFDAESQKRKLWIERLERSFESFLSEVPETQKDFWRLLYTKPPSQMTERELQEVLSLIEKSEAQLDAGSFEERLKEKYRDFLGNLSAALLTYNQGRHLGVLENLFAFRERLRNDAATMDRYRFPFAPGTADFFFLSEEPSAKSEMRIVNRQKAIIQNFIEQVQKHPEITPPVKRIIQLKLSGLISQELSVAPLFVQFGGIIANLNEDLIVRNFYLNVLPDRVKIKKDGREEPVLVDVYQPVLYALSDGGPVRMKEAEVLRIIEQLVPGVDSIEDPFMGAMPFLVRKNVVLLQGPHIVEYTEQIRFIKERLKNGTLESAEDVFDTVFSNRAASPYRGLFEGMNEAVFFGIFKNLWKSSFHDMSSGDIVHEVELMTAQHEMIHVQNRMGYTALKIPFFLLPRLYGDHNHSEETLTQLRTLVSVKYPEALLLKTLTDLINQPVHQSQTERMVLKSLTNAQDAAFDTQAKIDRLLAALEPLSWDRAKLREAAHRAYLEELGKSLDRIERWQKSFEAFLAEIPPKQVDFWQRTYIRPPIKFNKKEMDRILRFVSRTEKELESSPLSEFSKKHYQQSLKKMKERLLQYHEQMTWRVLEDFYWVRERLRGSASIWDRYAFPYAEAAPVYFFNQQVTFRSELRKIQAYLAERDVPWKAVQAVAEGPAEGFYAGELTMLAPQFMRNELVSWDGTSAQPQRTGIAPAILEELKGLLNTKLQSPLFSLDDGGPVHLIQPWQPESAETAALFMARLEWLNSQNRDRSTPLVRMTFVAGDRREPEELIFQTLRASAGKGSLLTAQQQARLGELLDQKSRSVRLPSALRFEQSENFVQTANALSVNDQNLETASAVISRETGLRFAADVSAIADAESYETPATLAPFYLAREQILAKAAQHLRKQPADRLQADKIRELHAFLFLKGTGFYLGRDGQTVHWSLGRMLNDLHAELQKAQQIQAAA